jgi:hypothetical protein
MGTLGAIGAIFRTAPSFYISQCAMLDLERMVVPPMDKHSPKEKIRQRHFIDTPDPLACQRPGSFSLFGEM